MVDFEVFGCSGSLAFGERCRDVESVCFSEEVKLFGVVGCGVVVGTCGSVGEQSSLGL